MNHRIQIKKLSKTPAHRKAMIRNMLVALFRHERIKTTLAKSKVLQRIAERMISRARTDSVANRRLIAKWVQDKEIHAKLFTTIAPLFINRKGGYTRIIKLGKRFGDASEMAYISLVSFSSEVTSQKDLSVKDKKEKNDTKKSNKEESKGKVSNASYSETKTDTGIIDDEKESQVSLTSKVPKDPKATKIPKAPKVFKVAPKASNKQATKKSKKG